MKVVIVSGVPGTGKTLLSKKLASRLNFHYIDMNKMIRKYKISEGYDKKRKTRIVDIKKLNKAIITEINNIKNANKKIKPIINKSNKKHSKKIKTPKNIKKTNGIIIDSHLSHYLPKKYVDLCIVTKCNLRQLKKRLQKRKYPKDKIRENMDAEIFDVCMNEAKENKHKILILDTTRKININKTAKIIKSLKPKSQ